MSTTPKDDVTIETAAPVAGPEPTAAVVAPVVETPPVVAPVVAVPASDVETTEPEAPVVPAAEPAAVVPDTRSEFERKVDELDPPLPDETPVQRNARMSRGEKRILGLLGRTKATEDQLAAAQAEIARLKAAPAATTPAPVTPAAATTTPDLPVFTFPAWDAYSEAHPEALHEDYIDARQDARETHKQQVAQITRDRDETARLQREFETHAKTVNDRRTAHVEAFRREDPEYDAVMATAMDLPLTQAIVTALDDLDTDGPAVAKHLAQHRDEYAEILTLPPSRQAARVLAIADTLKAPPAPTPAPTVPAIPTRAAVPSRPLSDAPAPGSHVSGGAQPTRSLQSIADKDEDADEYIVHTSPTSAAAARIRR